MDKNDKRLKAEVQENVGKSTDETPSRREMMRKALGLSSIAAGLFGLGAVIQGCWDDYYDWDAYSDWGNWGDSWGDYPDWIDSWANWY